MASSTVTIPQLVYVRQGVAKGGGGEGGYRERCQLLSLAEDLDVPQLVKVKVPFPLQGVDFQLHSRSLQHRQVLATCQG